jgi:hypothetical protein
MPPGSAAELRILPSGVSSRAQPGNWLRGHALTIRSARIVAMLAISTFEFSEDIGYEDIGYEDIGYKDIGYKGCVL